MTKLLCSFLLASVFTSQAVSIRFGWDPSPDPVKGYEILVRLDGETYDNSIPFRFGDVLTFVVPDLEPGNTYHFVVRAYDAFNQVSPFSNEVTVVVPLVPQPPGVLRAVGLPPTPSP